jgi:hypothetical protein
MLLSERCPNLHWMGDLRDWHIRTDSAADRKAVRKVFRCGWETSMNEPRKLLVKIEGGRVVFDTSQIVDGMMHDHP